jgi:hypothetical protein
VTPVVNLDRDRPLRHPWLTAPDELRDDVVLRPVLQVYRFTVGMGWADEYAASWAAWTAGLRRHEGDQVFSPWSMHELGHVLFLRDQVELGCLGGPNDRSRR